MNLSKAQSIAALAVALIGLGTWLVVTAWPAIGYETPNGHEADVLELRMAVANTAATATALEESLAAELKVISALVLCGQLEQRLRDRIAELQERQRRGEQNNVNIEREIEQLRERMGPAGLNCSQFG